MYSLGAFLVYVLADGAKDLSPSIGSLCWGTDSPLHAGTSSE